MSETGVGQGQVISPLLANIYLHYVLDEWFEREVKPRLRGQAWEVRYVDDFILCFQYREDEERVLAVLRQRFEKYGLTLHSEKTRLLEFGKARWRSQNNPGERSQGRLIFWASPTFPPRASGCVAVLERLRSGAKSTDMKRWKRNAECSMPSYGVITNGHFRSFWKYYRELRKVWKKWLNRRTRGKTLPWTDYQELLKLHPLLRPRITHSWAGTGSLV